MPLTMRPTGLGSPVDRRQDFTIYSGKWTVGRIYEEHGMPAEMQWFWSFLGSVDRPSDMRTNVSAALAAQGHVSAGGKPYVNRSLDAERFRAFVYGDR